MGIFVKIYKDLSLGWYHYSNFSTSLQATCWGTKPLYFHQGTIYQESPSTKVNLWDWLQCIHHKIFNASGVGAQIHFTPSISKVYLYYNLMMHL